MATLPIIDTSSLQGVIPLNNNTIEKNKLIDTSKLQGTVSINENNTQPIIDTSSLGGVIKLDDTPQILSTDNYSNFEKIRYGIDKQNTFFGNLYRVAKAGTQAAFDSDLEFKDYVTRNYNKEQRQLKQKYGNLASGAYDDDVLVQAAEMATFMADPFYLFAYMSPWGRAATATYKGLATISGVTIGLDTMLDQLATTGEIDGTSVATSTVAGAALGPLSVGAFRGIKKLLPSVDSKELTKVLQVIEGQKAKQIGVSKKEFHKLQAIAGDKELLAVNKQIKTLGNKLIEPIKNQDELFNVAEKRIENQIKKLRANKKAITGKGSKKKKAAVETKIKAKDLQKTTEYKTFMENKKNLWKKISKQERKVTDLQAKREFLFLKKLKEQKGLTRNAAEFVVGASLRPAFGAGAGYAFGRLWGAEDTELNNWMWAGASLGALNKLIQRSGKVFSTGEKNWLDKLIFNNATKLSFQKVRELTSTTAATKLKAFGGDTEKIGMKLFQNLDDEFSKTSASAISDRIKQTYSNRAFEIIKGISAADQDLAIKTVRGSKEKGTATSNRVANEINKWLSDFRNEYTKVGIGLRKEVINKKGKKVSVRVDPLKDYFPRVWNWEAISKDKDKFINVVGDILLKTKPKQYKTLEAAKKGAIGFFDGIQKSSNDGFYDKNAVDSLIKAMSAGNTKYTGSKSLIRGLPLSDHIENERLLTGTYAQVEKVLEKNGFLVNEIVPVLNNLVNRSADSIGFASQFGAKGQLLRPYLKGIFEKYNGKENQLALASKEIATVMNHIDAYFGRYGTSKEGIVKSGAGVLSTISNLNMLERVSIASLGDLIQPFTTSNNFRSWIVGLGKTGFRAVDETSIANDLGYKQGKVLANSLLKTLTPLDNATLAANAMGKESTLRKTNEIGFKLLGLQWLTGFARRYAYNTGAVDALVSAQKLGRFVANKNSLSSAKGLRLTNDLSKYRISVEDGLKLAKYKTLEEAMKNKAAKDLLSRAGITASNRDALIPQVSNRLIFTQSRDPFTRLFGQFMSWTLAKSAQTNKLLQRIENGDARQMVKLLAGISVYGGIQNLREISKYGEVITDPETETDKWYAEALRLSGLAGTLPELFINQLTGPGSRQPWFLFAPFTSILDDAGQVGKDVVLGDWDAAIKRFMQKIAPAPIFTKFITNLFSDTDFISPVSDTDLGGKIKKSFSKGGRVGYEEGDIIVPLKKPKVIDTSELEGTIKLNNEDNLNTPLNEKVNKNGAIPMQFNNKSINKGNEIALIIKSKLDKRNIPNSKNIAKGLTGNIYAENNTFKFNREEDADVEFKGYGLFQFTDYRDKTTGNIVGHRTEYNKYLKQKNIKDSIESQIEYVLDNIYTKGKEGSGHDIGAGNKESLRLTFLGANATNIAEIFMRLYENPKSDKSLNKRIEFANKLFNNKKKFKIGGVVSKLVTRALVNRGKTAITSTKGTYTKTNKIFTDLKKEKIHDFGSGKGVGSNEFKNKIVTSHEPFVSTEDIVKAKGKIPNYKTADEVILNDGMKSKDGIVNLNVLNVIENFPDRNKVVEQIGKLLANDGVAVITTRSAKDVINQAKKSKNAKKYLDGWLFGKGNSTTFQKGFGQKELEDYIRAILGKGFIVEKIPSKYDIKTTGILIKKLKEELV